jgi:hypothetical protein
MNWEGVSVNKALYLPVEEMEKIGTLFEIQFPPEEPGFHAFYPFSLDPD